MDFNQLHMQSVQQLNKRIYRSNLSIYWIEFLGYVQQTEISP